MSRYLYLSTEILHQEWPKLYTSSGFVTSPAMLCFVFRICLLREPKRLHSHRIHVCWIHVCYLCLDLSQKSTIHVGKWECIHPIPKKHLHAGWFLPLTLVLCGVKYVFSVKNCQTHVFCTKITSLLSF